MEDLKKVQIGPNSMENKRIGRDLKPGDLRLVIRGHARYTPKLPMPLFVYCARDLHHVPKERKLVEEKMKATMEETSKLLVTCFIREVQYPTWLANMVMVRKSSGKWRMCTNYTNLNKACPKDPYPLSSID
ncbi:hypothetical protein CR513_41541, partial [Mucuna pruriens]